MMNNTAYDYAINSTTARVRSTLAKSPLLTHLAVPALEDLAARVSVQEVASNVAIVEQHTPGHAMYVIMEGKVKVSIIGESGREVTLSILRAGDAFGEISLFDGKVRSASCITVEASTVIMLSREELLGHLTAHPQTALNLLGEMSRRLRMADDTIAQLAMCDVNERLCRTLVKIAREEGIEDSEGRLVRKRPTQQELANMVGSCRETVSRSFNQLARDGLIITRGRAMVVTPALMNR